MDIETIEHFLLNYFNEVRFVDSDIVTDEIVTISKENGVITPRVNKYIYNLQSLSIPSLEEVDRLLYLQINQCDKVLLKEPGFLTRLMGSTFIKKIEMSNDDWIITSNDLYNKYFSKLYNNIYVTDTFKDLIVVGSKNTNIIIHQNLTKFYINCSNLKVYQIKKSR